MKRAKKYRKRARLLLRRWKKVGERKWKKGRKEKGKWGEAHETKGETQGFGVALPNNNKALY